MAKTEIAGKKYDSLLPIFFTYNDWRPAMAQANRIGDITYSTNGGAMLIVPNNLLAEEYGCHKKAPNFQAVLDQQKACTPVRYNRTDLADMLLKFEKVPDMSECEDCDGGGNCPHCKRKCHGCNGKGEVEDSRKPQVYPKEDRAIRIHGKLMSPFMMDLLYQTVRAVEGDSFEIISVGGKTHLFQVGPLKLLICGLSEANADLKDNLIFDLKARQ